ncbi:hypothetical protein OHC51_00500 [Stenotrophomonas indicatrix]|uniref:hypothetical protein n=1 Tax=Stenotrophomonas indicatrix TaxID=2045451 RepID=UPI00300A1EC6
MTTQNSNQTPVLCTNCFNGNNISLSNNVTRWSVTIALSITIALAITCSLAIGAGAFLIYALM